MDGVISKQFLLTANSKSEEKALESNKSLVIVLLHSYSILDVNEGEISPGVKERLIKMRNPWGNLEWKGDWGDKDLRWNDDLSTEFMRVQ